MSETVVHRRRSVTSLLMMLFALALGAAGYVLVDLNQYGTFPGDWVLTIANFGTADNPAPLAFSGPWFVGVAAWFALGLAAWAVTVWRLPYADPLILPVVFLLCGLGISMIHRLDQADGLHSAELQMLWLVIAVVGYIAVVVLLRDHRRLQRYTYVWFLVGLVLLLLPLVPGIGRENFGARIWIELGPFSFQPSELAKIVLSVAFSAYLVEKRDVLALAGKRFAGIDLPRARDLGPIGIVWGVSLLVLVFQRDLGTTVLFFGLFVMMLYTATERVGWAILGFLLIIVLGFVGYQLFDHVQTRFESWLNPFADYDRNLQIISAQFGFAWGGLFGTGWGEGRPYLTPLAKNDFIAAALGEELGLFGLCALVLLFTILVARILRAALACSEPFGKLLAAGIGFVLALQVFAIIGGVTRLLPLTGLTTPFVSQGGSSLAANFLLAGLTMTITHQARRPRVEASSADEYASLSADPTQAMPSMSAVGPRPDPAAHGATPPSPPRGGGAA